MSWKTDPRYTVWKARCKIWQKTHQRTTAMPITPSEEKELEDMFDAQDRFTFDDGTIAFGDRDFSQRFVVIRNIIEYKE